MGNACKCIGPHIRPIARLGEPFDPGQESANAALRSASSERTDTANLWEMSRPRSCQERRVNASFPKVRVMCYAIFHHSDELAGVDMTDGIVGESRLDRAGISAALEARRTKIPVVVPMASPAFR